MAPKATFDADFGKFVSELTKVDVKLRDFEPAADKVSAKLQRMADSLNGNKLLEQAGVAVGAIKRIEGGVGALNNGELRRYGTLIDAATEKLVRQGREVPPALAQVKAAIDLARKPLDDLRNSADAVGSSFGELGRSVASGLGVGAGLSIFSALEAGAGIVRDQIVDVIKLGDEYARIEKGFRAFQGGAAPAESALVSLRTATKGLVTDTQLMLSSNQATVLGLSKLGADMAEVTGIATRLGAVLGKDTAQSIEQFTLALAKGSSERLDELGISLKASEAQAEFATRLGKSAEQLSDFEKRQAFVTIGLVRGREALAKLGTDALTAGQQVDRIGVAFENLKATVGAGGAGGGAVADFLGGVADAAGRVVDDVNEAKKALQELKGLIPGGDAVSFGAIGRFAGEAAIASTGLFGAARAGAGFLSTGRRGLQDVGLLALDTLPADRGSRVDLAALAPAGARTTFTERELDFAYQQSERLISQLADQNQTIERLAEQRRARLDDLTGRSQLRKAQEAIGDIFGNDGVGLSALSDTTALSVFDKLVDAKAIAARLQPELIAGFDTALTQLASNSGVLRRVTQDAGKKLVEGLFDRNALRAGVLIGVNTLEQEISAKLPDLMRRSLTVRQSVIDAGEGLIRSALDPASLQTRERSWAGFTGESTVDAIYGSLDRTVTKTTEWNTSLRNVSQAFANLSQVSGDLAPVARQVGVFVTSLDTAEQLVTSVGQSLNKDFNFGKSRTGQIAATGLAAGLQGWDVGTGAGLSPWRAAAVGGLTGAAAGAPALALGAATGGASIAVGAIVGATTAYFGAQKAASELRKAKDLQAETLVAQYGSLEALLDTAGRLGLNQETFLKRYYGEPKEFAKGVTDLNNALTREKNTADALATSLDKVAKAQGVLSRSDRAQLVNPRAGGPAEDLVDQFKGQQTESLLGGLDRILQAPGALSASLAKGVGQSFPAALAALEQQGASPLEALKTLMPLLDQFKAKAVDAGIGSTAGFDALNGQLALLKDERLGPLIERASGAGQVLGALSNLDLLDEDTFSGFTAAITETVAGMDLLSDQGQNAMRLIRGPLQNVWQLQQDFGLAVDDSTQALLDQAEASGKIGDKFRPAEEKLLLGVDRIVDRLDTLVDVFTNDLVTEASAGATLAGQGILDVFDRIRPKVHVAYEYDTPPASLPPVGPADPGRAGSSGSQAAQRATASASGGDIYLDSERVGYHTLRHAGDFADLIGA